jgi:amidase
MLSFGAKQCPLPNLLDTASFDRGWDIASDIFRCPFDIPSTFYMAYHAGEISNEASPLKNPPLHHYSAFELAADIRDGKVSSVEVLQHFLDRIERLNPQINAVIALDEERAMARAREADEALQRGESWGVLHGLPMTVKDALCTEGLVTVGGIPERRDYIPKSNAVAVQKLVDAGAIVFGKTNVPFMSSDLQSYNDVYGTTNNPWNTQRTCGGSSGGAAAAVAAGLTPLEIGSDIGGSIRTPSHFNGVFGHKPSFGIVSQRGHLPPGEGYLSNPDLSVVGPIANCAQDLEDTLDLIMGPDSEEATAWRIELPPARAQQAQDLRVAVWLDAEFCPVDKEVQAAIRDAAESLQKAGARVDFDARPDIDPKANNENYGKLLMASMGPGMPEDVYQAARAMVEAADPKDMSMPMLQMHGIALSHRHWLQENERRLRTRARWDEFFCNYDVLLCPCTHVVAFPHQQNPDLHARTLLVNGEQRPYFDVLGWAGLSLNSYLPASVAPVGLTEDGLPVGVQIVGPYLEDRTTIAVAKLLQEHHRTFTAPPGYAD